MFDFAYSGQMQQILMYINFVSTFVCHSVTAMIILEVYGEKASWWRIAAFAFFAGTLLNNAWTYGIYNIGGKLDFSALTYALVTVPNPIFALLYYLIGFKALNLSPIRSIRLMGHAYLYILSYKSFVQVIGNLFFPQPAGLPYNFLLDAVSLVVKTFVILAISLTILRIVRRRHFSIDLRDAMFIKSVPREIVYSFIIAAAAYAILVVPQIFMKADGQWGTMFSCLAIILIFVMDVILDINRIQRSALQNKDAYISTLRKSVDEFRGLKHDYSNILLGYGGYIEMKDPDALAHYHAMVTGKTMNASQHLELAPRLEECPAIIALIMQKLDYAGELHVDFRVDLQAKLRFEDHELLDISRCIGCLLDNAIEAASESERKSAALSWEMKPNGNMLLVVTNSTKDEVNPRQCCEPGYTTKDGHSGLGLATVRNMIDRHARFSFSLTCYQSEFSAFIEVLRT